MQAKAVPVPVNRPAACYRRRVHLRVVHLAVLFALGFAGPSPAQAQSPYFQRDRDVDQCAWCSDQLAGGLDFCNRPDVADVGNCIDNRRRDFNACVRNGPGGCLGSKGDQLVRCLSNCQQRGCMTACRQRYR